MISQWFKHFSTGSTRLFGAPRPQSLSSELKTTPPSGAASLEQLVAQGYDSGATLRTYGKWFLQLQLDEDTMLNFWGHPSREFPPITPGIHNHRREFTSVVARGRMFNRRYDVQPSDTGNYQAFIVRRTLINGEVAFENVSPSDRVEATLTAPEPVEPGESYVMKTTDFHSTEVLTPTVTILHFRGEETPYQQFLVPYGKTPTPKTTLAKVSFLGHYEAWHRIDRMVALAR